MWTVCIFVHVTVYVAKGTPKSNTGAETMISSIVVFSLYIFCFCVLSSRVRDRYHLSKPPSHSGKSCTATFSCLPVTGEVDQKRASPGHGDGDDHDGESELTPCLPAQSNSWAGAGAGPLIRGAAALCPPQHEATEGTAIQTAA